MSENAVAVANVVSTASSPVFLETVKTWVTYIGILAVAVVTAYAGIRKALKDLKTAEVSPATGNPAAQSIVAGTILENYTLMSWSESNRGVVEALEGLTERLESAVNSINYNTEAMREQTKDQAELRHQVERLRDKMR